MDRQKVKSGLGLMFWGNIVALFAVIPILGVIAALVGGIMELIAIVNLRKQSENYNNAFWFTIAGIVLGLFAGGDGLWGTAMSILHGLATLGATYYICTATEECVSIVSYEVADYCHSVCNWYVTCMVISLAISVADARIFNYSYIRIYRRSNWIIGTYCSGYFPVNSVHSLFDYALEVPGGAVSILLTRLRKSPHKRG